ncbi:MAG: replication initiator protein A [Rhodospirillaceae bacterium]|nr:replication initiator protein A [Rhodospirillaceae bacterium]
MADSTDLAPARHQPSLFLVDLANIPFKEFIPHLEHPFFGLSTRPRREPIRYEDGRGNWLELLPTHQYGLPTIFDQDLVIYAASAIMAERKAGREIPRRLKFHTADLIEFANRSRGGRQYLQVEQALYRLTTTNLRTNIVSGKYERTDIFGIVDRASIVRRRDLAPGDSAALLGCSIVLSDWMIEAILSNRLLTLHPDYFRLRRPFDRRIYQIARKHCGKQESWQIELPKLYAKAGSSGLVRHFRQQFRDYVSRWRRNAEDPSIGPFLDYESAYDDERDMAIFHHRSAPDQARAPSAASTPTFPSGPSIRFQRAFVAEFPELDLPTMQRIWQTWSAGKPRPRNPDAAFLGFCRSWLKRRAAGEREDAADPFAGMLPGDPIHPDAMTWWQAQPPGFRHARQKDYRVVGKGKDWQFFRTDKQLIERVYRDWTGRELPKAKAEKAAEVEALPLFESLEV